MAKPPQAERLRLAGPAGALEALIEIPGDHGAAAPATPPPAFAVVCHPHPLHGGTLDNKVVWTVTRACHAFDVPTIRFNFRGVGASEGAFDCGRGETRDALAAVALGRQRWPEAALWLAGFSFGGVVALQAAAESLPACLIAIAPGITRVEGGTAPAPACPWLVVQGGADEVVPAAAVSAWAHTLSPPPELRLLEGAGHFFHGRINELRDVIEEFLERHAPVAHGL